MAKWPGARPVEAWPQNYDEVTLLVALTKLDGYSEEVVTITPREN